VCAAVSAAVSAAGSAAGIMYGVATIRRLLKIIGLFCTGAL